MKSIIYLACFPAPSWGEGSVKGFALAEDGEGLASHLSSSIDFSKHDMGLTSNWKHNVYEKLYPGGFELVWIDKPETDERWQAALALNKARDGVEWKS